MDFSGSHQLQVAAVASAVPKLPPVSETETPQVSQLFSLGDAFFAHGMFGVPKYCNLNAQMAHGEHSILPPAVGGCERFVQPTEKKQCKSRV